MADDLVQRPARRTVRRSFRRRFVLAYLGLAVVAGAGGGGALLLLTGPGRQPEPVWSAWRPAENLNETGRAAEIARYVSRRYRLPSGSQLVGIPISGEPLVPAGDERFPVRAIAIRPDQGSTQEIRAINADDAVMYVMCGFGENCSIREGEPTQARHRLLRRQALELALYSFKHGGAKSVIVLLPPAPAADPTAEPPPSTAIFFERRDLSRELERPLSETLARSDTPGVTVRVVPENEMVRIERLTRPHIFAWELTQSPEGSLILILNPLT